MKYKRFAAAAAAVLMVLSAPVPKTAAFEQNDFSFEESTAISDCIVLASYIGETDGEYKFKTIRMLKGGMSGNYFYLTASEEYAEQLEKNGRYILYLDRDISVYYDHDKYTAVSDILITADEKNNITDMTCGDYIIDNPPANVASLKKYVRSVKSAAIPDKDYIRSKDLEDISLYSNITARVTIKKRISDYSEGCGVYLCTVMEEVKGKLPDEIKVILFDDAEIGEEYYLYLNNELENGKYILSSKNSMIIIDGEERLY